MSDFAAESGHFYHRDGSPAYEVPNKSKGGMRPTTVRDAKALDLVPSVTTITALAARPGLDIWKQKQVLLAALTLPRVAGEDVDAFAVRVAADSREQAKKAAERGTAIHAAIEQSFRGEPFSEECRPWVEAVRSALPDLPWGTERSFAHPLGFGGKVDLWAQDYQIRGAGRVLDFKTKDGDLAGGIQVYDEQYMQLAAYRVGLGLPAATCANVFISRDEPVVLVKEHSQADLERGWNQFLALLTYWHVTHGRALPTASALLAAVNHVCDLPESIKHALNSGDGAYRP